MSHLKLFPKIFIYTLGLMLFVVGIAHVFIYFLTPRLMLNISYSKHIAETDVLFSGNSANFVIEAIQRALPISFIFCILISVVCSLLFSRAITNPIQNISATTERMTKLDKAAQCSIHTQDEIGVLADNINHLYYSLLSTIEHLEEEKGRVQDMERSKADFLRAASHELKTPVTALNATLENMILRIGKYQDYNAYLPECKEMAEQLSVMIHNVLEASKSGMSVENNPVVKVDMAELLSDLCEPYQLIAEAHHIRFTLDVTDSFGAEFPRRLFERAISNILSNAVTYTEKGKFLSVYLKERHVVIENECTPIPQDELSRLFEPFYRPDFSRSHDSGGNGLGLYIVNSTLTAMKIKYSFVPMEQPIGMRFTIQL